MSGKVRMTAVRKALAALLVVLGVSALVPASPASADGTEMLGTPSIPIAEGTGVVSEGVGLFVQPGTVNLNVPGAVKQVLAYWECLSNDDAKIGDHNIVIAGEVVEGDKIGHSPYYSDVYSATWRADITSLGLVTPGINSLSIDGLHCLFNDGASIVVIYDDGGPKQPIDVRDGNDTAYVRFNEPNKTTVPVVYNVAPSAEERVLKLTLIVGGVDFNRPNQVWITVDGVTEVYNDNLNSTDEREWDNRDFDVIVPAGATTITVQVHSVEDDLGRQPASLQWAASILTGGGPGGPVCNPSPTAELTHGSAYGLDASLLNVKLINKLGYVATVAPGAPSHQAKKLLSANLVGLVSAKVNPTTSDSSINPPKSTSSSTLAEVNLLGGLVKAAAVRAVSQSFAGPHSASYNSQGSTVTSLVVSGKNVVVKPTTVDVVNLLGIKVAELKILDEAGTSSFANGVSSASHRINALKLTLLKPFLGFSAGTVVIIGHAESDAVGPTSGCPDEKSVSGEAFTASVNGYLGGKNFVGVKVNQALLPKTGGYDSAGIGVNFPGIVTSGTAVNTTYGSLTPHPSASSRSYVEKINVLNGLVTAKAVDVRSSSSATGTAASTTFSADFLELQVGGKIYASASVAPNTKIVVDLGALGYVVVTLNERVSSSNGLTDTEGTINAIHVQAYAVGGLIQGDIVVASAHSDAHA